MIANCQSNWSDIRIVDHPNGYMDFIRHSDGKILVQTNNDKQGRLWIKFVDKTLLPNWPKVPSWYPVEQAVADAIELWRS